MGTCNLCVSVGTSYFIALETFVSAATTEVEYLAALTWPWLPRLFIRFIPLRFEGVLVDETKMVSYSFPRRSTDSYWERFERLNAFNSPVPHLTWNLRSPSLRIRPLGGARCGTVVLFCRLVKHSTRSLIVPNSTSNGRHDVIHRYRPKGCVHCLCPFLFCGNISTSVGVLTKCW